MTNKSTARTLALLRAAADIARVKLALVTLNDPTDVHQWSGLNFHIARSLESAGADVVRIGPLDAYWSLPMRVRQRWFDMKGLTYYAVFEPKSLTAMGKQARALIPGDVDAVVAVTTLVAASVGAIAAPLLSWDDATPAAMNDYYPDFKRLAPVSRAHGDSMGRLAARSVQHAAYASGWAAASARAAYGMAADRVSVVPFGANVSSPSEQEAIQHIAARSNDCCRLLWVGVEWERKGGPLALAATQELRNAGINAELTIVGCTPPGADEMPSWVRREGFVSKNTIDGRARLEGLFANSHFFLMPSHAEAYGLVYVEAAAFGVPSVALKTGGVPTIIIDGETGVLVSPDAAPTQIAERIAMVWRDRPMYERMCRAAKARERAVLNWNAAGAKMLSIVEGLRRKA